MNRAERFEDLFERYEGRKKILFDDSFDIEEFGDFYKVHGISYRGEIISCDFAKEALPERPHDEFITQASNAKDSEFRAASVPLAYAIFKALYQNRGCLKNEVIANAQKSLKPIACNTKGLNTLSQVFCNDRGFTEFVHDHMQATEYVNELKVLVRPGYITNSAARLEEFVHALLDTDDSMQEVNDIFGWVTGEKTYAWPHAPLKQELCVAFVKDGKGFCLSSECSTDCNAPALGVRRAQKKVAA